MSLDVTLSQVQMTQVYDANITHNLTKMATAAGVYFHVWRPDEIGIKTARELIEPLTQGIALMKADPEMFRELEPENKWGTYGAFLRWLEKYLEACKEYPDSVISVSR